MGTTHENGHVTLTHMTHDPRSSLHQSHRPSRWTSYTHQNSIDVSSPISSAGCDVGCARAGDELVAPWLGAAGCGGNGGGGENLTLTPPDRRRCWCRERCPVTWWSPWTPPAAFRSRSLPLSVACFVWEVAKRTAEQQLSKTRFLVMLTAPPPVLMAMPAPELAWIRLASRLRCELFQDETPSPRAPLISFARSITLPPLATTFAPRLAKAIVLPSASSSPRYILMPGPWQHRTRLLPRRTRADAPTHMPDCGSCTVPAVVPSVAGTLGRSTPSHG
mmetsp:Transcript_68005/g.164439  ORF Transcript_68005/g.164439 Transcript_68005/m.164439 type:complete len:276 (+) Transcript_68005:91-918(+)